MATMITLAERDSLMLAQQAQSQKIQTIIST